MAQKRDEGGKFVAGEVDHSVNWDLNELKFETPEGTAVYKYAGLVPYVKEIRQPTKTLRGIPTWETAGYEEVERDGRCVVCGKRVFYCDSPGIEAPDEIGDRIVAWKKVGNHEPPLVYCKTCIQNDPDVKAQQDEQEYQNSRQLTAYEQFLQQKTRELGGKV